MAEQKLWRALRAKRFAGYKFRRQHPIARYIADFACPSARLVIEIDGGQHAEQLSEDARRTTVIAALGWRIVRFWNSEVLLNLDGVLFSIEQALNQRLAPPP